MTSLAGTAYAIPHPPADTPAVSERALLNAWDTARAAAAAHLEGPSRRFLFRNATPGDPPLDLILTDRDACCWAEALDRRIGLDTRTGMALLLRLLALVEVMGRAPWMRGLFDIAHDGTTLHPDLLRAAATQPLDAAARFDEEGMRRRLARLPPGVRGTGPIGARPA
ncbi:hypothetical protein ACE7GA_21135 [Roseomonas sp. CCTCC AB2023176]|uniref:hypothetical protein n=1 Tax=Roseomonas sp. CCTCC AB2023176 TaxID=3342640 RepID=UPI0035E32263